MGKKAPARRGAGYGAKRGPCKMPAAGKIIRSEQDESNVDYSVSDTTTFKDLLFCGSCGWTRLMFPEEWHGWWCFECRNEVVWMEPEKKPLNYIHQQ